jgi:hypothetical protein
MKNQILKTGILLFAAATFTLSSCKKEMVTPIVETAQEVTNNDINLTVIADQVDADYLALEIDGGDENIAFSSLNDGLIEEYLLGASSFDKSEKGNNNKLIRCLKGVDLSSDQIAKIRKALAAYEDCKATSIKKHRAAYGELKDKVEAARKELVKKYRNEEITKEEFQKGMKSLRERFNNALKNIKASYAKSLRACFEKFLGHLKEILSEKQWKAFLDCYKK